jgi:hypothetical protein
MDILNIYRRLSKLDSLDMKILEVGSGPNGIGEYISNFFVGCDIKFDGRINPKMLPVVGSATNLPFRDESFDIVLSIDMLEHIKRAERAEVINELIRVSKRLTIIACPCGRKSQKCEQKILLWYQFIRRKYPDWLIEHVKNGLPSENEILQVIQKRRYLILNNENVFVHACVIMIESLIAKVTNKLAELLLSLSINFKSPITRLLSLGEPYRKIFIIWRGGYCLDHE